MRFYHLSHTDLDGYGCQFITKKYFNDGFFYNANYGLEIKLSLEIIIEDIKKNLNKDIFLLISDLNLTYEESRRLDETIKELNQNGATIKLLLLDHHGSGKNSAKSFEWYYLDTSRCATKITYDYFKKNYNILENDSLVSILVNAINAVDIWLEHETYNFEYGKVMLRLIGKANEINATLFPNENRNFRLFLLEKALGLAKEENRNIVLDDSIHFFKKEYLSENCEIDTIDNLSSKFLVKTLEGKKEQLSIFYKDHKGLLTYNLGSISIPANAFLKANPDYDFFIDLNKRGTASFRADGNLDVSQVAAKIAGGGGHPNASGCKFKDFEETIIYEEVKDFIQNKLDNLEVRSKN